MTSLTCYTDGGFYSYYNLGAYAVVFYENGELVKEISGSQRASSPLQMELLAVIKALEYVKPNGEVTIYSDCKNLIDKATWLRDEGIYPTGNFELWTELQLHLIQKVVRFEWVNGHTGIEGNEKAHRLATWQLQKGTRKK